VIELRVHIKDKSYDKQVKVLQDIDFTVGKGDFVAIIGPSGCGKTTLLNMISGLESCADNSVLINGNAPGSESVCNIGYIFQQPRLMPWLTVQQNLNLVAKGSSEEQIECLLRDVGLGGKGEYFPRQLSGGMQRRVGIARAFLIKPQLLLLDEPFNSLDAPTAARLRLLLIEFSQQQNSTVVYVTHDLREAIYLADRIIFLGTPPSSIVHQVKVDLPRPRLESGIEELKWQANLMLKYPNLLAGSIN
jgi:ABC-type nitrate/sulfonate/bicarbonate transport system ATPase subunit